MEFSKLNEHFGFFDNKLTTKKDPINPNYYKLPTCDTFQYQTEVCARIDGDEAPCVFNVLKYVTRYNLKNGLEDLNKAAWYLNKLIEIVKEKNNVR